MPEFKDMLKYFRMREHLSQSELADKLGVSASRISMYEVGKREPDFETEEKIADFFNTDLNTLRGKDTEHYYFDPEVESLAQEMMHKPNLQMLCDASRNLSQEDMQIVIDMVNRMNK